MTCVVINLLAASPGTVGGGQADCHHKNTPSLIQGSEAWHRHISEYGFPTRMYAGSFL